MITPGFVLFLIAAMSYIEGMEKVAFVFLNEYSLNEFLTTTTSVLLKPNLDNLTVECSVIVKEMNAVMAL